MALQDHKGLTVALPQHLVVTPVADALEALAA